MATETKPATPASGAANTAAAKADEQAKAAATGAENPMLPEDGLKSTPTGDVSPLNTVGNPSPGTEAQRQWAANTTQSADQSAQNPTNQSAEKPESRGEPIESTVIKKHYSKKGALIEPGATVYYQPVEGEPYPWPLMRPVDEKLNDRLKGEYDDAQAEKQKMMDDRNDREAIINRLATRG